MQLTKIDEFYNQLDEYKSIIDSLDPELHSHQINVINNYQNKIDDIRGGNYIDINLHSNEINEKLAQLRSEVDALRAQIDEQYSESALEAKLELKTNMEESSNNLNHQLPGLMKEESQLVDELNEIEANITSSYLPDDTTLIKLHLYRQLGFSISQTLEDDSEVIQIKSNDQSKIHTVKLNQSNYSDVFLTNRIWDLAS